MTNPLSSHHDLSYRSWITNPDLDDRKGTDVPSKDKVLAAMLDDENNNNNIFYLNTVGFKANIAYGAV